MVLDRLAIECKQVFILSYLKNLEGRERKVNLKASVNQKEREGKH